MGNSQSESQRFIDFNWRRVSSPTADIPVFENIKDKNFHIQQYHIETISEDDFDRMKEIAFLRKNNPRWVSALYFQDQNSGRSTFCASKYQADLYLQTIPIRLSNIRNIPFPDALHVYDQALNGYSEFAKSVGRFAVQRDYMGINQRGVVKVWAGARWDQISAKINNISEEDMVRSIISSLEECTDQNYVQFPSLSKFFYRNSNRINFQTALKEFKQYTLMTNMGSIPSRLNSIQNTPSSNPNDRQLISQIYQPRQLIRKQNSEVARFYSPQPFSSLPPPIHSVRIQQQAPLQPQNVETIRRVNSFNNLPVFTPIPQAPTHQQVIAVQTLNGTSGVSRPTIDRSLSNPQFSKPMLASSSSSRQILPIQTVQNSYNPVNSGFVPVAGSQVIQVNSIQQPFIVGGQNQQSKQFVISKQQDLSIIPPSQTEIPYQQQVLPSSSRKEITSIVKDQQKSSSIVMPALVSTYSPVSVPNSSKYLEQIKSNAQNASIQPWKKESQSSIKGTPTGQYQSNYYTPIGINKKELSNLNSIEEVQTEHYWKDNSSKKSQKNIQAKNAEPYSLSTLKQNFKIDDKELTFKKYTVVDSNDGKSSDDFLQKLKSIGSGTNITNNFNFESSVSQGFNTKQYDFSSTNKYDFGAKDYSSKVDYEFKPTKNYQSDYLFQKKDDAGFSDVLNTGAPKNVSSEFNFKQYEFTSKNTDLTYNQSSSEIFKKYASGGNASYNGGIDPELWADLNKGNE